jgi:integrase
MRGFTRKRGKSWTAYWEVQKYDPDTRTTKRQQRSKGGFTRQKDAQAHLDKVVPEVNVGVYVEPSRQPLGRFLIDEWLPAARGTVRPGTHRRYEEVTKTYIARREVGGVPLRGLSGGHLTTLYGELERAGLSVGTRRLVHAVLSRALSDAVRWGKLARNPAAAADPPALPRSKAQSWSARELRLFLAHVEGDRLFALWRLAATTGMRRGEVLGLSWRALELDGARLKVERQAIPTQGGVTFGPPKSRRSERTVALDADTVAALRHHRDTQRLERDLAGPAYEDGDLVFCDELGRPVHPQRLTKVFLKHRKAAGIPTGSLHVLRHTAATLALTATPPVPLHVVAGRLGDDPKTVLSTYAHLLPHSDAEAAQAVAAALADKPLTNGEARELETAL